MITRDIIEVAVIGKTIKHPHADLKLVSTHSGKYFAVDLSEYPSPNDSVIIANHPYSDGNYLAIATSYDLRELENAHTHFMCVRRAITELVRELRGGDLTLLQDFIGEHPHYADKADSIVLSMAVIGNMWDVTSLFNLFWGFGNAELNRYCEEHRGICGYFYAQVNAEGEVISVSQYNKSGANNYNLTNPNLPSSIRVNVTSYIHTMRAQGIRIEVAES